MHEQPSESLQHVLRVQLAFDVDGQVLSCVLVNDRQQAERAPLMRPVVDEIVRPNVVPALGAQTDAGPPPKRPS